MTQYLPWCPCCRTAECEHTFGLNSDNFWSFKETNWPGETPVFDTEWKFFESRVELKNRGAFTLVLDTEDPMTHYSSVMIEAAYATDSLTTGSECGVTLMMPWEPESISLWWLGGTDYELRQGTTVLEAFTTAVPPTGPFPTWTFIRLVLVNATASTSDVECWVQGQLVHTETNVAWAQPEILDFGMCVNGEVHLKEGRAAPCGLHCIIEHECAIDTRAPEIWTLHCPPVINKTNPDLSESRYIHCQDSVSGFFSGSHTLVRQYHGKTQGLIEVDHMAVVWPRQFKWQDCFDGGDSVNHTRSCAWIAVSTESQGIGVAPYLCYSPVRSGLTSGPWVCNMEVVNDRDPTKYPIRHKGFCPSVYDEDENFWVPGDEWFGPTAIGDCSPESAIPGDVPHDGDYYPNGETWRIFIRYYDEVPEWQRDQETIPMDGFQVVAVANFSFTVSYASGDYGNFTGAAVYYSEWYTVSQPIPSSAQITLERQEIRYPIHVDQAWEIWYEFPNEITVYPNGTGDNDSYTRYCRGLTCRPIIDPEENAEYTLTMTYQLPDDSLLVDEPTLTAYFQEDDDSWEWFGPGQPISLVDCPGLGSFYYHIHCIKEANGGRGQWVLDISTLAGTSRLNMVVDEELGITFEGTVTSGCDGQDWDGIGDELQAATVPQRWGSCLPNTGIGANVQINCLFDPVFDQDQVELKIWDTGWMTSYENTIIRAGNFQIDGQWFAIAVWPLDATSYKVEIRKGPLMRGLGGVGTNWHSLAYITDTVAGYFCHPEYGYPILEPTWIPYGWGSPGEPWAHDPFSLCPDVPGGGGGEVYIAWN